MLAGGPFLRVERAGESSMKRRVNVLRMSTRTCRSLAAGLSSSLRARSVLATVKGQISHEVFDLFCRFLPVQDRVWGERRNPLLLLSGTSRNKHSWA